MATYLQGVTDIVPQIAPFQPDFGLVQKTLSTLQSRYDQGFASLKNAYNQVLNAPLSDVGNRAVKDQFFKEAQNRLKDLASVDLSLPENQSMAENVFAPFWEDNMIVQDAGLTKWYQNETRKASATRDAQDEKVRSQYSDVAVRYLQNGWEKLQQAGRDPDKYNRLEKRRFVPFQDIQGYLDNRAKDEGLKIEWKAPDGPYMKTIRGGPESLTSFETFAENALGDKFDDQFRIMGIVDKEEKIKGLKSLNPGLSDEGALDQLSHSVVQNLKKQYDLKQSSLQNELTNVQSRLESYGKKGLSASQEQEASTLLARESNLKTLLEKTSAKLNKFKDETRASQEWAAQADSYFSDSFKQRAIRSWANAKASNQQISYDINPVWRENMTIDYQKQDLALKWREDNRQERELEWKMKHPWRKGSSGKGSGDNDYDGYDDDGTSGDPESVGKYEGLGSTDITKLGSAYERFVENKQALWDYAHSEIFDIKKGLGSLLYGFDVDDATAAKYMSVMDKLRVDQNAPLNDQEKTIFNGIGAKLKTYTGVDAAKNFAGARTAILEAARKKLVEKTAKGGSGFTDDDVEILDSYTNATQALKKYEALESERNRLVQEHITKDPETYKKILIVKNGKYDIATSGDIVKDFKPITLRSAESGDTSTLTAKQFAELYVKGDFNYAGEGEVFISGKKFYVNKFDGHDGAFDTIRAFNDYYYDRSDDLAHAYNPNALEVKYGSSQEQKKLRDQLNTRIVPNLSEYQTQTGKMGVVVGYDLTDKHSGGVAAGMINEAANAANREGIYIGKAYSQEDTMNDAVIQLMSQGREELKKHISKVNLNTVGVNGRPSLEIILKPVSGNDKLKIGDKDMTELAGKKIEIDLNPNPSGDLLRKVRYNSGLYIYGSLLNGGHYDADPIMDAAGFHCTVAADRATNPSGVIIRYTRKLFNQSKGIMEDQPEQKEFYSFAERNPDEIMAYVHQLFRANLRDNAGLQKLYQQQNPELRTVQDLRAAYDQQRGQ